MSIKNDIVLSYIQALDTGAKISVRGLSGILKVSEGTVYKAIKEAEARGLVMTRPKAGTFRINTAISNSEPEPTLSRITKILGLGISAGAQFTEKTVRRIVVCDSDVQSLIESIGGNEKAAGVLCIAGNRPDIQQAVIEAGAHLLVSGGSRPCESLIIDAEKNGVCILSSLQSTYALLRLLDNHMPGTPGEGMEGEAGDWMQAPQHLYYNDITADWHRLYHSISAIAAQYPVVDDDLKICGSLDIAKAFAANPSQKVSGVLTAPTDCLQITTSTPVPKLAELMVLDGKSLAAVTLEGKMCGLITANDLLRYYLYFGRGGTRYKIESFLEETREGSSGARKAFSVHFPKEELENISEFSILIMVAGAKRHAEEVFQQPCALESGTFFTVSPDVQMDDLMLTSIISRPGEKHCAFEVEVHDEIRSYTKSILVFSHA